MRKILLALACGSVVCGNLAALTLDRVILSTDANPHYLEFWPIVARAWREVMGVKPTLALIASKDVTVDESLGDVIRFEPIPGIPTSLYAQVIRLLLPILFENEVCVISDIDSIPLSKEFFTETITLIPDDCFVIYRDRALLQYPEYAMCYNAAKGKVFQEIFGINSIEQIPQKVKEWHALGLGCTTDKKVLYRTVRAWTGYMDRCVKLGYGLGPHIDKLNWAYDVKRLKQGYYIGAHMPRPYSKYRSLIDSLVRHAGIKR